MWLYSCRDSNIQVQDASHTDPSSNVRKRERSTRRDRENVLGRGIVGRVPWCKDYMEPLPYALSSDMKEVPRQWLPL